MRQATPVRFGCPGGPRRVVLIKPGGDVVTVVAVAAEPNDVDFLKAQTRRDRGCVVLAVRVNARLPSRSIRPFAIGRTRVIPIRNEKQREVQDPAHALASQGSLILANLRNVDQIRRYEHQVATTGLSKMHGLRRAYAQQRYLELTG